MNTTDLYSAKRDLETAVKSVARYMLQPDHHTTLRGPVFEGKEQQIRYLESSVAGGDLYYFSANAANRGAFEKRLHATLIASRSLQGSPEFLRRVASARLAYDVVEVLAKQERARKTEKRAAVQSKRDLKAELNLQEGVSLKGVDVGQYKAILAGLEPVRLHVLAARVAYLTENLAVLTSRLDVHGSDTTLANPRFFDSKDLRGAEWDRQYKKWASLNRAIRQWFDVAHVTGIATAKSDNPQRIQKLAEQFALAYVQGYACKLAVKTGEAVVNDSVLSACDVSVLSASVSSSTLWQDSTCQIKLHGAGHVGAKLATLTFHTQIIWNRSCLGKVFNQYPTRRV